MHRPRQHGHLRPQPLGQPQCPIGAVLGGVITGRRGAGPGLDMDRDPGQPRAVGHAPAGADHRLGLCPRADTNHQPLPRRPGAGHGMGAHIADHLFIDPLGGRAQRQLAQRRQIAAAEEMQHRPPRLVAQIDLALAQAPDQIVGRQIDQLDLVGHRQHVVGQGLPHPDAGDALDDVVQAFQMLDVERGQHVDAGIDQLGDILKALFVARPRDVGVGEFVDQGQGRTARQHRIQIHLGEAPAAMGQDPARDHLQPAQQRLGLGPAMGLDHRHRDIGPFSTAALRLFQHRIGLTHAGGGAQEDLEPAAALALRILDQRLRGGSVGVSGHRALRARGLGLSLPRGRPWRRVPY